MEAKVTGPVMAFGSCGNGCVGALEVAKRHLFLGCSMRFYFWGERGEECVRRL